MFLLDANVFIEAKNRYYDFDICPGFWDWLDAAAPDGVVCSITRVYEELATGGDTLALWAKDRRNDGRFLRNDEHEVQRAFQEVVVAVQAGAYRQEAKVQFLSGADPLLVAKAMVTGATIVTLEKPEPAAMKRVPLPNICQVFRVPVVNTFELLRARQARFCIV